MCVCVIGGGIALLYGSSLSVNKTGSTQDSTCTHYEHVIFNICCCCYHVKLFIVYRSSPSAQSAFKTSAFVGLDFWKNLTQIIDRILVGDLMTHMSQMLSDFTVCSMLLNAPHVSDPTHHAGHSLHVVITHNVI